MNTAGIVFAAAFGGAAAVIVLMKLLDAIPSSAPAFTPKHTRRPKLERNASTASMSGLFHEEGNDSAVEITTARRLSKDQHERAARELPSFPIWRVAITGGPCSGKSTSMKTLKETFEARGFKVFIVPEVATLLINGGLDFSEVRTPESIICAQKLVLLTILQMEDNFVEIARNTDRPSLILCDRGTMDGRAYCTEEEWKRILSETQLTVEELRDARYDAVIHLVTAAIGAKKFYTTANNEARRESPEQAAALDHATKLKWLGHRLIGVIDNSATFKDKVQRVVTFVENLVATERPGERANLVVRRISDFVGLDAEELEAAGIEETHVVEVTVYHLLPRPRYNAEHLVHRSTKTGDIHYLRGRAPPRPGQSRGATNYVRITPRVFSSMLSQRLDERRPIVLKRHTSFFYKLHHFTITECLRPETIAENTFLQAPLGVSVKDYPPFVRLGEEVEYQKLFPSDIETI